MGKLKILLKKVVLFNNAHAYLTTLVLVRCCSAALQLKSPWVPIQMVSIEKKVLTIDNQYLKDVTIKMDHDI